MKGGAPGISVEALVLRASKGMSDASRRSNTGLAALMRQCVDHDVRGHPGGGLALFLWIVVNLGILQSVTYVRLISIEND
jgi:hypothetical protein